jgi:hypothetical protein
MLADLVDWLEGLQGGCGCVEQLLAQAGGLTRGWARSSRGRGSLGGSLCVGTVGTAWMLMCRKRARERVAGSVVWC